MRKIVLLSISLFVLIACNNQSNSSSSKNLEEQTKSEKRAIGGDTDEHGCLGAAGEKWSELKQECIRVFNIGERLNPVDAKSGELILSAFVVFNDDKSKLELFLPGDVQKTTILNKSDETTYQNDVYKFTTKDAALYINGVKKYQAEKK